MKARIGEIIEETNKLFKSKGWGRNPKEINDGYCSWFAMTLEFEIGDEVTVQDSSQVDNDGILTSHTWVIYKSKHYDAETPDGVDDYLDLPQFKRMKKQDLEKFLKNRQQNR